MKAKIINNEIENKWWQWAVVVLVVGFICVIAIKKYFYSDVLISRNNPVQTEQWKKIAQPNAFFYTRIFLDRNNTYINIPYKFEKEAGVVWLSLESTPSANLHRWLVYHPTMEKVDWKQITDGKVTLWQRRLNYKTIEQFKSNPPGENELIKEASLDYVWGLNNIKGKSLPDIAFDLTDINYILGTYKPSKKQADGNIYENIIDASMGIVDKDQNLSWLLYIANASEENAFYVGEIHVDFNRKNI